MNVRCIFILLHGVLATSGTGGEEDTSLKAPRLYDTKLALVQTGVQLHAPVGDPDKEEAAGILQNVTGSLPAIDKYAGLLHDVIELPPGLALALASELGVLLPNISKTKSDSETKNPSGEEGHDREKADTKPDNYEKAVAHLKLQGASTRPMNLSISRGLLLHDVGQSSGSSIGDALKREEETRPHEFPPAMGNLHLLASVAVLVHISGINVHAYDIAFYMKSRCRAWGPFKNSPDRYQQVEDLKDNSLIYLHFATKWVNRAVLAAFVDNLIPACERASKRETEGSMLSFSQVLDEYKRKLKQGPQVGLGSTMLVWPRSDGVELKVNDQDLGIVQHRALGSVTLHTYFDEDTLMPTFRREVFRALDQGYKMAMRTSNGAVVEEKVEGAHRSPWRLVIIVVVACLVLSVGFWRCLRRNASVDKDSGK